jgi:uncharacterized protein YceK
MVLSNKENSNMIKHKKVLVTLACTTVLVVTSGCGTATEDGLCKPASNSAMVAATTDTNGKPWSIAVGGADVANAGGQNSYEIKCAGASEQGSLRVTAVIKDSLNIPKAGLVVAANLGGISSVFDLTAADTNTDSCGTARFDIDWKCPDTQGDTREGALVVSSGALSGSLKISITHFLPVTN